MDLDRIYILKSNVTQPMEMRHIKTTFMLGKVTCGLWVVNNKIWHNLYETQKNKSLIYMYIKSVKRFYINTQLYLS